MGLSLAEKDALVDLIFHPGFTAFRKEMERYVVQREESLLKFQFKPGAEDELHFKKAQAQASREFYNAFVRHLDKIKKDNT